MTEQEKIDRGQQAAALLEHPLMNEALSDIADMCLRQFAEASPDDLEALAQARRMLQTATEFQKIFKRLVMEGRNAATTADFEQPEII